MNKSLLSNIPDELKRIPQWVLWRLEYNQQGRLTKVPYYKPSKQTERKAEPDNPSTWMDFERTVYCLDYFLPGKDEAMQTGVGFVLTEETGIVAIDIDDCFEQGALDTTRLSDFAGDVLNKLNSYSERTPSGNGLRIFVKGSLPQKGNRKTNKIPGCSSFEMSQSNQFLTVTGDRLTEYPCSIWPAQEAIDDLYKLFPQREIAEKRERPALAMPVEDSTLLSVALQSRNGVEIGRLYSGDTSAYGGDDSAADQALCNHLAFYCAGDAAQMDRLFRGSGLMRDKWDEMRGSQTYGEMTIQKAISSTGEFYSPPGTMTKIGKTRRPNAAALAEGETAPDESELPTIIISNKEDRDISAEAWDAIRQFNDPPVLYVWGREISRVVRDPEASGVLVDSVDEQRLLHRLRRVANWKRRKLERKRQPDGSMKEQTIEYNVPVPGTTAKDMLSDAEQIATLPALRSVVTSPIVSQAGELISTPGYDAADKVYLATYGIGDAAPKGASQEDAVAAFKRLFADDGLFGDFPFDTDADRSHAAALLFTQFLRPYINDTAPMFLVEAPTAGTGKSKLARNLIRIATPSPRAWEAPTSRKSDEAEAEWTKVLGAALKDAPPVLFLDNLRGVLASTALESLLTSIDPWSTRLLKTSTEITVFPKYLTTVATSNNAEANRDMVRRSVSIRLDSGWERPEDRTEFRIADLDSYIDLHRVDIMSDVLTVLAAWIAAGRPEQTIVTKGSFERWARIVGGVLAFCRCNGFLGNEKERAVNMDPLTAKWNYFVSLWATELIDEQKKPKEALSKDLIVLAEKAELISDAYDRGASKSFGNQLQKMRDRVFGDWKLIGTMGGGGINKWRLKANIKDQQKLHL